MFGGLDYVQPFLELRSVVFESVLKGHTKNLIMFGVNLGLVIDVFFSYLHSEAIKPHVYVIRDGFTMEGSDTCLSTFDTVFNDGLGVSFGPSGDDIFPCINIIALRVSLQIGAL